jgi:hypothetical protein
LKSENWISKGRWTRIHPLPKRVLSGPAAERS